MVTWREGGRAILAHARRAAKEVEASGSTDTARVRLARDLLRNRGGDNEFGSFARALTALTVDERHYWVGVFCAVVVASSALLTWRVSRTNVTRSEMTRWGQQRKSIRRVPHCLQRRASHRPIVFPSNALWLDQSSAMLHRPDGLLIRSDSQGGCGRYDRYHREWPGCTTAFHVGRPAL